jgi:hypothetical protein
MGMGSDNDFTFDTGQTSFIAAHIINIPTIFGLLSIFC